MLHSCFSAFLLLGPCEQVRFHDQDLQQTLGVFLVEAHQAQDELIPVVPLLVCIADDRALLGKHRRRCELVDCVQDLADMLVGILEQVIDGLVDREPLSRFFCAHGDNPFVLAHSLIIWSMRQHESRACMF